MANQLLDAKGLNCPLPILKAKKALKDVPAGGTLEVLATDPGSVADFAAFCRTTGNELVEFDAGKRRLSIPDQAGELNEGKPFGIKQTMARGPDMRVRGDIEEMGCGNQVRTIKTPLWKGQSTGEAMQRGFKQRGLKFAGAAAIGFLALASYPAGEAQATEGYFQYGWGARQGGLGGAGVADSRDAMSLSLNPAGLVDVDNQFQAGASVFAPFRGYTATATGFIAPGAFGSGTIDSSNNYFVVPNLAYSSPIDADFGLGRCNVRQRRHEYHL